MIIEYDETYSCEGMCYSPERVLTEIFSLESAFANSAMGISLSQVDHGFYLQEIARTISIIALQCRQQVYSYFLTIKAALTDEKYKLLSNSKRISELDAMFPTASMAIKSQCDYELCKGKDVRNISFLLCIRKLCHVEQWKYPIGFNLDATSGSAVDEKFETLQHALVVDIAETDSVIGLDKTNRLVIDVSAFATAARVLITECKDCNLPPIRDFDLDGVLRCD